MKFGVVTDRPASMTRRDCFYPLLRAPLRSLVFSSDRTKATVKTYGRWDISRAGAYQDPTILKQTRRARTRARRCRVRLCVHRLAAVGLSHADRLTSGRGWPVEGPIRRGSSARSPTPPRVPKNRRSAGSLLFRPLDFLLPVLGRSRFFFEPGFFRTSHLSDMHRGCVASTRAVTQIRAMTDLRENFSKQPDPMIHVRVPAGMLKALEAAERRSTGTTEAERKERSGNRQAVTTIANP
jgi:hypothetical protein